MNGVHDVGGMHGMGPIRAEPNEPVFHAAWEGRTFAMLYGLLCAQVFPTDEVRHAVERMPPAEYFATEYYEHWLYACEKLLVEHGIVTVEEFEAVWSKLSPKNAGKKLSAKKNRAKDRGKTVGIAAAAPEHTAPTPAIVKEIMKGGVSMRVEAPIRPKFAPGDRVRGRNIHPMGHTRLPRYARGREGAIERDHGVFVFADANAHGKGPAPQHLYAVRFSARELWGDGASPRDTVVLDLWDDHLERA